MVNEVLANEPGRTTSLEWIELYNNSLAAISLSGYQLQIGDTNPINLPDSVTVPGDEYYLVCQRLFASESSPGFESFWGDSSGVWGDTPYEESLKTPFEAGFSLKNDAGSVALLNNGLEVSSLIWIESGLDGHSWERILPEETTVGQSIDNSGSTPGFINSLTPVPFDLSLDDVKVEHGDGYAYIIFIIVNRGLSRVDGAVLYLTHSNQDIFDDTIDVISIPELSSGQATEIARQYVFDGIYLTVMAILSDDDRVSNNVFQFVATGSAYPPIILTELLANPQNGLSTEWLEIKNRSEQSVDLYGWQFGDTNKLYQVSQEGYLLEPGAYLVLVQSADDFLSFYPDYNQGYIQPGQWSAFNNDGDIVRLVDSFGIEADRFEYSVVFDDNYTWSRGEEPDNESQWGRSENVFGTPGEFNQVVFEQTSSDLSVRIEPVHFSPDGDGFEDYTTITISAPRADGYTVKVFDRRGRVVKAFYDKEEYILSQFQWDGLSDGGRRLPIGVYILFVEAHGGASVKKPIVIAR